MPENLLPLASLFIIFAAAPFALFRARARLGSTPLWIYTGGAALLLQFLNLIVPIGPWHAGFTSISVFPALLALALLVYVRSGVGEARTYALALVGVNLAWAAVAWILSSALSGGAMQLWIGAPQGSLADFFRFNPRALAASSLALTADLIALLVCWQWLENHTRLPLVVRSIAALGLALGVDSLLYVFVAFWPAESWGALLKGHLAAKAAAATLFGSAVALYLQVLEPRPAPDAGARDTLEILRYKETLQEAQRALERTEQRYRGLFENNLDAVLVLRGGRILDMNRRAEQLFGRSRAELMESSGSSLGLPDSGPDFQAVDVRAAGGKTLRMEIASVEIEVEQAPARMVMLRDVTERDRAAEVIRAKNRELEALNSVAELGIRSAPVQDVLREAVARVQSLTAADSCAICLVTESRSALALAAATGISEEIRRNCGEIRFGLLWKVFQAGQPLVENDLPSRSDARRDLMEKGVVVHATAAAPVVSRGRVIGTVSVCSYRPRTFGPGDSAFLATVGAQLGTVIENARLNDDIRQQKEVSEILLAAATAFGRSKTVDEVADALLDAVVLASRTNVATLILYDPDRDVAWVAATAGLPEDMRTALMARRWGPGDDVFTRLREARGTILMSAAEMKAADEAAWRVSSPPQAALIPLFLQDRFLGALTVNLATAGEPDPRMMSMLEGLAGLCAAALSNLRLWGIAERRALLSTTLLAVGQDLVTALDPERVARTAAKRAREILKVDAAGVCLAVPEGFRVEVEDSSLQPLQGRVFDPKATFDGRILRDTAPIAVTDLCAPGGSEADRRFGEMQGARGCLCSPIRAGDRVLGAIHVATAQPRRFAAEDATALSTLATWAAICLENARLLQDLSISNDEIRDAQSQVVKSESLAAIGRLSASIAHEIRNPLSGISAAAQALLRASSNESSSNLQLLRIIDRETRRLNRIITDFLLFARPKSPVLRRVSVPALVDSTVSLMEAEFAQKIRVTRDYAADLPAVQADGDQLKQVLLNLLMNSVQAMPGGGTIAIAARPSRLASGPAVELDISDSGAGIPAADLGRVFEPFYSTKKEGTGLGLAIAHQIVTAHGGSIAALSPAGQGAMFRVTLPAAAAPATPVPAPAPAAGAP